jgi:hypothetical protein
MRDALDYQELRRRLGAIKLLPTQRKLSSRCHPIMGCLVKMGCTLYLNFSLKHFSIVGPPNAGVSISAW